MAGKEAPQPLPAQEISKLLEAKKDALRSDDQIDAEESRALAEMQANLAAMQNSQDPEVRASYHQAVRDVAASYKLSPVELYIWINEQAVLQTIGEIRSARMEQYGTSAARTLKIQSLLANLGFNVMVDGVYGARTEQAVKQLQLFLGYKSAAVDGKAGNNFLTALEKKFTAQNTPEQQTNETEISRELDPETRFYCEAVDSNAHQLLGTSYNERISFNADMYVGTTRTMQNHCVGFCMSAFDGLPFRAYPKGDHDQNAGRFVTEYEWGVPKDESARDGWRDFIPDLAGHDPNRYRSYVGDGRVFPKNIDAKIGKYLKEGEYAVAATVNHTFWIYKKDGKVMMVHSGDDVNRQYCIDGAAKGKRSCANEVPLADYMRIKHPDGTRFAFVTMTDLVAINREKGIMAENITKGAKPNYIAGGDVDQSAEKPV